MGSDTRDRIITATVELLRRHGYNGTSLKQVTIAADAPFGSLYHFFPEGKEQLVEAALESSGRGYRELFEAVYDAAASPADAIRDFFVEAADVLESSEYIDICPVGTVAREVAGNERLRQATARVLLDWHDAVAGRLREAGAEPGAADELASTLIASVEGAFMLCRAMRSSEPIRHAGRLMQQLVAATLTNATPPPAPRRRRAVART